jgi:hypothetical protein
MPSNVVKTIAKKSNKTVAAVEKLWDRAKATASKKMKKSDKNYWGLVTHLTKRFAHLKKGSSKDFNSFIKFEMLLEAEADRICCLFDSELPIELQDNVLIINYDKFSAQMASVGFMVRTIIKMMNQKFTFILKHPVIFLSSKSRTR